MNFDPRCVGFEGRLHADGVTLSYVGRANHDSDAACFRSRRSVAASASSQHLRLFYFETHVLATNSSSDANISSNSSFNSQHAAHDQDRTATIARDWRRSAELQAMDMEDVQTNASNGREAENPMHFAFTLSSRTLQQMRTRHERRRLRRSSERKRFSHKVAVGFILDGANSSANSSSFTSFPSSRNGILEARLSRRAVKQLMQRVLPDATMSDEESDDDEQEDLRRKKMAPKICHRDLGMMANSLAYVGSTGRVVSHGREFLQCERYGAGDVVGCGVLLDTNTFFFTLNGGLMGMLEARDVYDLDDFGEMEEVSDDESSDDSSEDDGVKEENGVNGDLNASIAGGVGVLLNKFEDVDMEDSDGRLDEEKVLYPSISLHGVGESVRAMFGPEELRFDLVEFEQQVQKERQRALLEERELRGVKETPSDIEQMDLKDEAAMDELVQDFFLHYGYESAYQAFKSDLAPSKRCRMSPDIKELENGNGIATNGSCHMSVDREEEKHEDMEFSDKHPAVYSPKRQHMCRSLSLRHEVREHIRGFRTAQALNLLEHNTLFMKNGLSSHLGQYRKLMLYCRILCLIDILTREAKSPLRANGVATSHSPALLSVPVSPQESSPCEIEASGWNPEPAIEYARQAFGSSFTEEISNGKRKRQGRVGSSQKKCDDVALAMSLLLYDRRASVPAASRAQRFLTPQFRESVADQLNSLLLMDETLGESSARVSSLETFIKDLGDLQKECLHHGCRVYPESIATASTGKYSPIQHHSRRSSLSSNSDESSSSQSQSDQDDHLDDDDGDGE
ncbi:hypothetical protein PHYBOEH_000252 [Phytophthora boehmeriae]|uniref:SPRY domain-containing protein n=1 Tax=Phytophthora boehmeriae TaxID=109152 RepID=A0A8T1VBN2_9STRA|nr:hypothetical protein PHYBOEH_000252 [Phytophthora boehmeriae]